MDEPAEAFPYILERFLNQCPQLAISLSLPMSQHSLSSEEEEDLPPLQYARQNGLSRDHLVEPLGFLELQELQWKLVDGVHVDTNLSSFDFGHELKFEDRLTCSKEAALLLASVTRDESEDIDSIVAPFFNTPSKFRRKKLELPLLRTDHQTDSRSFASREGFDIKLRDVKLPLEAVGERAGFDWTSKYENLGAEMLQELKQEKLSITRDTIAYLQDLLSIKGMNEDEKNLWDSEQKYKRKTIFEPVTPPLSPLPVKPEPFEPASSDPAFQIPVYSDPPSPTKQNLEDIEEELLQQDIPTPLRPSTMPFNSSLSDGYPGDMTMTLGDIYPPLASLNNSPIHEEVKRVKPEDLKVEEPMTPEMPVPVLKSVRFSDIIEQLVPEPQSSPTPSFGDSTFFQDAFGPAYEMVNQRLEQEQLVRADTTARVDVPMLRMRKPDPPWKQFEEVQDPSTLQALQKSFVRETVASSIPLWPGSRQKESSLPWSPFASDFANFVVEEDIQDDETNWKAFVRDDQNIIDSSSLTWKPLGLKILRAEDDDDEIELGQFQSETPADLSFIVKKRKMELQERENFRKNSPAGDTVVPIMAPSSKKKTPKPTDATPKPAIEPGGGEFGFLDGVFSVETSLDHYLELRGTKRAKVTDSTYFAKSTGTQPAVGGQTLDITAPNQIAIPIRSSPVAKREMLPAPLMKAPTSGVSIIVSSTLLKNRALIKSIEAQLPSLNLVERDFTAHNTSAWMPGSISRSPVKSPLDSEADFVISPSVGVILTTLQKIKQKPLPGQKTKPAIHERLEKVSPRYEKLVVLVSEGNSDESTNGLDNNDCLAVAEFIGFASGFETSINVQFIGGGGETLSKWLASTITQHRINVDLLPEETYWELFLRRAGLNAFAAQSIIAELKAPDGVDAGSPSKSGLFGLTAFVEMGREERVARFGQFCGRKMLERVSRVVDAVWE